jgi:hypothetical protein
VSGATKLELGSPSPSRQALLQQQQQLALLGSVLYDRETLGRQAGRQGLLVKASSGTLIYMCTVHM